MSDTTPGDDTTPSSPKRKKQKTEEIPATQGDGPVCPICLDSWSSTGAHRLVSLKCGHLFGQVCIEKWLGGGSGKCPQCNGPARKSDIRAIYAKVICAVDNHERDDALRLLDAEKLKRSRIEQLQLKTSMQCQFYASENSALRHRVQELESKVKFLENRQNVLGNSAYKHGLYAFRRSLVISSDETCSIYDSDAFSGILAVAKKLENAQSRYGVLKISSIDSSNGEFTSIHSNQIRDMKFNPEGNCTLLTCGKDKQLRLTCMKSNTTILTYHTTRDIWSCSWSEFKTNVVFCGLQNGEVLVYDVRNTREAVDRIVPTLPYQKCPVISINPLPGRDSSPHEYANLVVASLQGISQYSKTKSGTFESVSVGGQTGALSSVSYHPGTNLLLATYKPGNKTRRERHVVMKLDVEAQKANEIGTFLGGSIQSLRSRTSLVSCPEEEDHMLVVAGDQSANVVRIWSTRDMSESQTLSLIYYSNPGTVVTVGSQRATGVDYLVVLTNEMLFQYKWSNSSSHRSHTGVIQVGD